MRGIFLTGSEGAGKRALSLLAWVLVLGTNVLLVKPAVGQTVTVPRPAAVAHPIEKFSAFGQGGSETQFADGKSAVFFMRDANAVQGKAVNVYLNGDYLTSLLPGGFKQSPACVGINDLSIARSGLASSYAEKQKPQYQFELENGEKRYFAVVADTAGTLALEPLAAEEALPILARLKEQTHGLSRVGRNGCSTTKLAAPAPAPQEPEIYKADAQVLFKYGQSGEKGMLEPGRSQVASIPQQMRAENLGLNNIKLTGHTDPEGSKQANMRLSQARATNVSKLLTKEGVPPDRISAQGRGFAQLAKPDCRRLHPHNRAARNACNQANRRVDVEVEAVRFRKVTSANP